MRNRPLTEVPEGEIQPWHSLGGVEHICELRKSCTVLYGIFIEIARLVYHDPDGRLIGTPDAVWRQDGTDIWIDSELRWEDQHPEVRPAIYIQLSPLQVQPYIKGTNAKVLSANRFGERTYAVTYSGSVTFVHIGTTSGEACALADNTEYNLSSLQDPICKDFCFNTFELAGRTPLEKMPKESRERFASAVTFNYSFDNVWLVKQECPILKAIDLIHVEDTAVTALDGKSPEECSRQQTVSRDNIFTETKVPGGPRD